MGKYIVEVKDGETLYKAVIAPDGEPYITPAMGNVYTEPDVDEAYQQGLNDAWAASRKVVALSTVDRREVFGSEYMYSILEKHTASEAIEKIRQYEQESEEKITKGDVVRIKSAPEVEILVTYADEEHVSGIALTEVDGNCEIGDQYTDIVIHKVEKTGSHYEIAEVLRKMREE